MSLVSVPMFLYIFWAFRAIGRSVSEVSITPDGIQVLPIGLVLSADEIAKIWIAENLVGAKRICFRTKRCVWGPYHVFVWRFGHRGYFVFDGPILSRVLA